MNTVAEQLNRLIAQGHLSAETLSAGSGIDKSRILDFLNGNASLSDLENIRITELAIMLTEGMKIENDDRIKGIIDILKEVYKMNDNTIAYYTGVDAETIRAFMKQPDSVSYEKRYQIAVKTSILNYMFKHL